MRFLLLFSRQGKLRLQKWFTPMSDREKKKIIREMTSMVLSRQPRSCNFLHWKDLKIIYKRWALPCTCCLPGLCLHVREDPRRCGKLHFTQLCSNRVCVCVC